MGAVRPQKLCLGEVLLASEKSNVRSSCKYFASSDRSFPTDQTDNIVSQYSNKDIRWRDQWDTSY
eukprot:6458172-Amphidinium_carterae.7